MKNTMGYGLNSLLDHTRPVDILAHLVVGSEGTLAFVASVVMRTVPLLKHAMTGLLVFETLSGATGSLPALVETGPATIELLDAVSLRVGQADPQADESLRRITVDRHAALLVEYQADSAAAVADLSAAAHPVLCSLPVTGPAELTADPRARARLWHTRKGLYATVAEARPSGTHRAAGGHRRPGAGPAGHLRTTDRLFARHGYDESVIFGHAKDGNIHFMLTEQLGERGTRSTASWDSPKTWSDSCWDRAVRSRPSTAPGRMMAPYVRRQYGDELYEVMQEIKRLCDPRGILNPGVLISDDPDAHIRHLKVTPTVEDEVDRCVECGYCEPVCPSRDLSTTPRQRIVLRREMQRAESSGDAALLHRLQREYEYDAIDTCAVDGMCQTACPVLINTGDLMKRLRADNAGKLAAKGWGAAAKHWAGTTRAASLALTATRKVPSALVTGPNRLGRKLIDPDTLPLWSPELPGGGRARAKGLDGEQAAHRADDESPAAEAVYFTACVGAMFGPTRGRARSAGILRADLPLCRHHADLPGRAARSVLRNAVAVQGDEGRLRRHGAPGATGVVARPAGRVSCRSSATHRRAPKGCGRCWKARSPLPTPDTRRCGSSTRSRSSKSMSCRIWPRLGRFGHWRCTPPVRPPAWA